jgi:hypothetical protein
MTWRLECEKRTAQSTPWEFAGILTWIFTAHVHFQSFSCVLTRHFQGNMISSIKIHIALEIYQDFHIYIYIHVHFQTAAWFFSCFWLSFAGWWSPGNLHRDCQNSRTLTARMRLTHKRSDAQGGFGVQVNEVVLKQFGIPQNCRFRMF